MRIVVALDPPYPGLDVTPVVEIVTAYFPDEQPDGGLPPELR